MNPGYQGHVNYRALLVPEVIVWWMRHSSLPSSFFFFTFSCLSCFGYFYPHGQPEQTVLSCSMGREKPMEAWGSCSPPAELGSWFTRRGKRETGHSTNHAVEHAHPSCPLVPQGTSWRWGTCVLPFQRSNTAEELRLALRRLEAGWELGTPSTSQLGLQKPEGQSTWRHSGKLTWTN